ncbi:MAG: phasin family protein [Kiloniellales bacterium]
MAKATTTTASASAEKDVYKMFDFTKFDTNFTDFSKFAKQFGMPNLNGNDFMAVQKKNLEAVTAANRIALEGLQALARRQAEIVRQSTEDFGKAARELSDSKSFEDTLAKQADLVKDAYEQALANVRELTEMTVKSQSEAVELINARVAEGFDEFKAAIKKTAAK